MERTRENEARLEAFLEAHEAIVSDIGSYKVMADDDPTDHITGQRESLLRVEELIAEMTFDD